MVGIERVGQRLPYQQIERPPMSNYWVTDLSNYNPINLGGHWGDNQAGFNLSLSGRIWLTDNHEYPCHRNLIDGEGDDETVYSGIYSWNDGNPELYTYPFLEQVLDRPEVREGLKSLIGVHMLTKDSPVISNCSQKVLFKLGDL